jgi:hypothetical protein
VLWPHLEQIRALRFQRKKWKDIQAIIATEHGVKVTERAVRNFFVRSRTAKLPVGLEHLRPEPNRLLAKIQPKRVEQQQQQEVPPVSPQPVASPTAYKKKWNLIGDF